MFQKILVAIDHTPDAHSVFESALTLAQETGASLMLLHILLTEEIDNIPISRTVIPYYYPTITQDMIVRYQEERERVENCGLNSLRSLTKEATDVGVKTEFMQQIGDPKHLICQIAKNWNADLIMVGRRGRTGLSELILGSVSNYILHHASCSVLIIQGQAKSSPEAAPLEHTVTS